MTQTEHQPKAFWAALVVAGLGVALPGFASAQPGCVPAPAAFELCDLQGLPDAPPAPEQGTLVLALGDLWLDISEVPDDFDSMSETEILELFAAMSAESAQDMDGADTTKLSRTQFENDGLTGTTLVLQEMAPDDISAHAMAVASHDDARLFLALHGDSSVGADQLEHTMAQVLTALRPARTN
jgi:hypothetical protein